MRIVQTHGTHQDELRYHVSLPGNRNGRDVSQEDHVFAFEMQLGERISREAGRQQLQNGYDNG
ncbi:hypothetical protein D3C71_2220110 [compost metagenome]